MGLKQRIRGAWQAALIGGLLCLSTFVVGWTQTLTVSGNPTAMKITSASAGLPPNSVTEATTTYSVTTNNKNKQKKITAQLNTAMPAGMSLTATMVAPTGATSDGTVTLDATARELVGDITNTTKLTNSITYVLSATPAAGVVTSQSRTVTFTLASWP